MVVQATSSATLSPWSLQPAPPAGSQANLPARVKAPPFASFPVNIQPHHHDKTKRTLGQKLFDSVLYGLLVNALVFGVSVYATYKTNYGKPGNWLMKRGDVVKNYLMKNFKTPPGFTKYAVMLGFSFLDGCLVAPLVKVFEDHRQDFVKWLDRKMGTVPAHPELAYAKDPKQSWLSVLGGRTTGVLTIVPAFYLMSREIGGKSLNDRVFNEPGIKAAKWLDTHLPVIARKFPKLNTSGLLSTVVFEAFFTALTTLALYVSSRFYASSRKKGDQPSLPRTATLQALA